MKESRLKAMADLAVSQVKSSQMIHLGFFAPIPDSGVARELH